MLCVRRPDAARAAEIVQPNGRLDEESTAEKCGDVQQACRTNWQVYYDRVKYRGPDKRVFLQPSDFAKDITDNCSQGPL
jgi:hypothetical protein